MYKAEIVTFFKKLDQINFYMYETGVEVTDTDFEFAKSPL